jgi:hypothetical protein
MTIWFGGGSVDVPDGAEVIRFGSGRVKPLILYQGVKYKHCSGCGSWRRLEKFSRRSNGFFGLQNFCKDCMKGQKEGGNVFTRVRG